MTDFAIPITVPNGKTATFVAALGWHYGQVLDNGVPRDRTAVELRAMVKADVQAKLTDIFQRYNQKLRDEQNVFDTDLGAT